MIYFVSLKVVAIVVGLIIALGHLPAVLSPEKFGAFMRKLPRNYPLGVVLMLIATIWFTTLTGVMDLGELSTARTQLMVAWAIGGLLVIVFVPGFLAARGLGCILLLAAVVLLDSAFLVQTPLRYVMTILAYVWVISGMVLVYSPHRWRDLIDYATKTPQRLKQLSWPGVVFGIVLIALGFFVYP